MRYLALCAGVLFLSSCASLQQLSSGSVGCPSEKIAISDIHNDVFSRAWTANCNGKVYYCSEANTGYAISVSCKEANKQSPGK